MEWGLIGVGKGWSGIWIELVVKLMKLEVGILSRNSMEWGVELRV